MMCVCFLVASSEYKKKERHCWIDLLLLLNLLCTVVCSNCLLFCSLLYDLLCCFDQDNDEFFVFILDTTVYVVLSLLCLSSDR
jgi:hypothetical protein